MNFFAYQAKAKSNTTKLVLLMVLAVVSLITITQVLVITIFCWTQGLAVVDSESYHRAVTLLGPELFWSITFFIIAVVVLAALYKSSQLASGGKAVAEAMDGVLINGNTSDADERKILNVVEEMAIASGIPVPPVYIIEENAINSFAAGYTTKDAVIGITRGCIQTLNRDELQGVIGHEFSHIFNGDMRLNIRLISTLYGILFIGMIGHFLLRYTPNTSSRFSRDQNAGALLFLGAGLYVIGYAGTFFGNLIKAAVSRQREFLADASAVQFTRNPEGIGNALKKIGGYPYGSLFINPAAHEISHLLFNQGISRGFSGLLATHPPIEERIKRIDPQWQVGFIKTTIPYSNPFNPPTSKEARKYYAQQSIAAVAPLATSESPDNATPIPFNVSTTPSALDFIGRPSAAHVTEAQNIISSIPEVLMSAAHDLYSARAVIYCLLLDKQRENIHTQQLKLLESKTEAEIYKDVLALKDTVALLPIKFRLPLINICMPTLKQLRPPQYDIFKSTLLMLIQADNKVDLFEWSLYRILVSHLEHSQTASAEKYNSFDSLQADCQRLISAVALKSANTEDEAKQLFSKGWSTLKLPDAPLIDDTLEQLNLLNIALKRASALHPLKKPQLIKACCAALKDDTQPESIELIRAVADGLDVPMPPLLTGQSIC